MVGDVGYLITAGLTPKNRDSVATLQVNPSSCLSVLTSTAWREGVLTSHDNCKGTHIHVHVYLHIWYMVHMDSSYVRKVELHGMTLYMHTHSSQLEDVL